MDIFFSKIRLVRVIEINIPICRYGLLLVLSSDLEINNKINGPSVMRHDY